MIDQPTIDRILEAANILDVVSEFITLRKRGVNYVGLCPFHRDTSPSFYVSPAKNICKCFACGEGGTAVHFIMKHEQISYFDALRFLAKKYNIEIQERELSDREKQIRSDRESMLIVNSWAQQYFTSQLHEHMEGKNVGLRYFAERGFREDTIRKFQLGYSLDQRDSLFQTAIKNGYKKEFLEKTGLVIPHDNGTVNDRFRERVMFPIHSLSGKVVAFGGRTLKKEEKTAKYLNSPESEIYHKSNELYGIFFAKQAIVKADRCYLVEGYTDVISMHQAGVENVVASSGTALTQGQIRMIHRFTKNITVLYDGDAAGIKAALRGIDLLLEEGLNVKVLLLPNGEDPDSFARKHNATQFIEFIQANETDFIRFKTALLLEDAGTDPIKRSTLITDIIRTVAIIPDNIARLFYIRECSSMMEIGEQLVMNEVNKIRQAKEEKHKIVPPPPPFSQTRQEKAPAYPEIPDFPPLPEEEPIAEDIQIPTDLLPPIEEGISEEKITQQAVSERIAQNLQHSPYKAYEQALLRYVVRYGERILFEYDEEETNRHIIVKLPEYIQSTLACDEQEIQTPILKKMLEEAVRHCSDKGFIASRYFLAHPDPNISRLAANMLGEKYQLSKYHTKYKEIEQEENRLDQLVIRELQALKNAYLQQQIKQIETAIKKLQDEKDYDMQQMFDLLNKKKFLDELKELLGKRLGDRIVLKM